VVINLFNVLKFTPFHSVIHIHLISLSYHILVILPSHFSSMEQMLMLVVMLIQTKGSFSPNLLPKLSAMFCHCDRHPDRMITCSGPVMMIYVVDVIVESLAVSEEHYVSAYSSHPVSDPLLIIVKHMQHKSSFDRRAVCVLIITLVEDCGEQTC